jgi:hypothetical protein
MGRSTRRDLLERLEPFSPERQLEMGEAGNITTRSLNACHDAEIDGIGHLSEHDRYSVRRLCDLDRRHRAIR